MTFKVTLPPPPNPLKPNRRPHWAPKAKAVKKYKSDCSLAIRAALGRSARPRWPHAVVMAIYRYTCPVAPDYDNVVACMKTAQDALQHQGIIEDDRHLLPLPPLIVKGERDEVELWVDPSNLDPMQIRQLVIDNS